ncbi:Putative F0F1-ATPase subunit Ca2+/Mg2+ transporter [Daejeonella rubra]|uniref:Putative F0F1-ATPase subunit Ca2+/Mg2+ transporter n=1 Tax=Daejeonella rubra TaxID=990371 RepID=A0A1G9U5Q9_9SPHI|nr:AtpZ/AtpI family protein [Daejeonella rubra]SDM55251.1 Putative F0F1-ATPase subunit Ca2+/Mg2+ transporter [Daejeonella rubra]
MGQEENRPNFKDDKDPEGQAFGNYAKYTGVAFQMMAIIGGSAYLGYKIDQWYDHKVQWVTALACVLGVCLSIYQTIKQLKP